MNIKAEIINIGDELLIGQVINSNASYLAYMLNSIGIDVQKTTSIPDTKDAIVSTLDCALAEVELILLTGGLGPTNDDITKQVLSDYFQMPLIFSEEAFSDIKEIFTARELPVTEVNRQQAYLPKDAIQLPNTRGTARGMWFEHKSKVIISMPGVPFEMTEMMEKEVMHRLKHYFFSEFSILHRTIMVCGIGESFLSDKIADWENKLPGYISLAYLPSPGYVRLRLTGKHENGILLQKSMDDEYQKLKNIIPEYIFAEKDITPERYIVERLTEKRLTVSTAESCTGGFIAHLLTTVSGSSACYKGSVVAYSNEIKKALLNISENSLMQYGAVSEQVVTEMAKNICRKMKTNFGIATSGIAGPTGAAEGKPIGTVWIAVSSKENTVTQCFHFGNDRKRTIQRSAVAALDMLRRAIEKNPCVTTTA